MNQKTKKKGIFKAIFHYLKRLRWNYEILIAGARIQVDFGRKG